MTEHRKAVKSRDPKNGIAMHVQETAHSMNWQEARILGREDNWRRRRVLEALVIQQRRPMINLDAGLILELSWTCFVCSRQQPRDRKCYGRRFNPYLRRTSFIVFHLAHDDL